MRYANDEAGFETGGFSQRVLRAPVAEHANESADELLYVLAGSGMAKIAGEAHDLAPGTAAYVPRGVTWSADGGATLLSVLVHEPAEPGDCAVVDLTAVEQDTATAGRQFVLGPPCPSPTQIIGLIPPGRAPDHFHTYDEVIYVLEGEGVLGVFRPAGSPAEAYYPDGTPAVVPERS